MVSLRCKPPEPLFDYERTFPYNIDAATLLQMISAKLAAENLETQLLTEDELLAKRISIKRDFSWPLSGVRELRMTTDEDTLFLSADLGCVRSDQRWLLWAMFVNYLMIMVSSRQGGPVGLIVITALHIIGLCLCPWLFSTWRRRVEQRVETFFRNLTETEENA